MLSGTFPSLRRDAAQFCASMCVNEGRLAAASLGWNRLERKGSVASNVVAVVFACVACVESSSASLAWRCLASKSTWGSVRHERERERDVSRTFQTTGHCDSCF